MCINFCSIWSIFSRVLFSPYRTHFCLKVEFDFDESSFAALYPLTKPPKMCARALIHTRFVFYSFNFCCHCGCSVFAELYYKSFCVFGFYSFILFMFLFFFKFLSRNFRSLKSYLSRIHNWIFTRWQATLTNQQMNETEKKVIIIIPVQMPNW